MKLKGLKLLVLTLILIICSISIIGCSTNPTSAPAANSEAANSTQSEAPLKKQIVAVTIIPQQAFVETVCGDLADVITMVPPGNAPGNYEPTPMQMAQLSDASVYFTIGVPTETANIVPKIPGIKTVSMQDAVAAAYPDLTFATGGRDPHTWLSPKRAIVMVKTIAQTMGELDEANKSTYEANANAFIKQIQAADKEIAATFSDIAQKEFIVYHPAFGYFADEYGLTMYALQEKGKDATPEHLKDMIDLAKEKNIKAIYYQAETDSSQVASFAEEIGGKTVELAPLSGDYINNLKKMAKALAENCQ